MRIQVDKIMIEKMNETYGLNLTYADFKKFYTEVVKPAKEKDPATIKRRRINESINEAMFMSSEDAIEHLSKKS